MEKESVSTYINGNKYDEIVGPKKDKGSVWTRKTGRLVRYERQGRL